MKIGFYASLLMLAALTVQDCWAIEGGFNVSGDRWAHAVRIKSDAGSCSATVITSKYAITAAHCVKPGDWSATVLRGDSSEVNIGTATLAFIDPRYKSKGGSYDVAVLSLSLVPGNASAKNKITLQSSRTYLEMLNAKSPYRTVLVVGHGLDERDRLGTRKAATVGNLTPHVGDGEVLWASYRPLAGATRPGDSGGGIYMLRESRMELTAVTSGGNTLSYKIDGDSFESTIERYDPIAPSLCKAPSEIRIAFAFDATECAEIETTRKQLSTSFDQASLPLLLHMMRLLNRSPQISILDNDYLTQELAVRALMRGAGSKYIGDVVVDYLGDTPYDTEAKARQRHFVRELADALIADGRIQERLGSGQSTRTPEGVKKALEAARPRWHAASRIAYPTALKNGEACPFDNCLKRNDAGLRLLISSAVGDWVKIFPVDPESKPLSPPNGYQELSKLVCELAKYAVAREDSLVRELLLSGISQSKISTFDSGMKRSISVGQGSIQFSAVYSDRILTIEIGNVEMSENDLLVLEKQLAAHGYPVKREGRELDAEKDMYHIVSLFNSYDGLRYAFSASADGVESMSYPDLRVWGCMHGSK